MPDAGHQFARRRATLRRHREARVPYIVHVEVAEPDAPRRLAPRLPERVPPDRLPVGAREQRRLAEPGASGQVRLDLGGDAGRKRDRARVAGLRGRGDELAPYPDRLPFEGRVLLNRADPTVLGLLDDGDAEAVPGPFGNFIESMMDRLDRVPVGA